jgi:hypothetical protein
VGICHAIAAGAVRQNHLDLPFVRFAPFFLIPFFRMLAYSGDFGRRFRAKSAAYSD